MKTRSAATAHDGRPSRLLIALAAVWMAVSIAVGGMATADLRTDAAAPTGAGDTASRP